MRRPERADGAVPRPGQPGRWRPGRSAALWGGLGLLVLAEIGYPLAHGPARARLVVVTVLLGYLLSVLHAGRAAVPLVAVTTLGGFLVEAVGVAGGYPFGSYAYGPALGPKLLGVPLVIPLAWTWMAWPAWLAAARLAGRPAPRILLAGVALASWDLFLDPQMVAERYWTWRHPAPALPWVPGVPLTNYLGWLAVAVALMAVLAAARPATPPDPAPMYALYLWTYASGVLAHAVFLGLPGSALWGGVGMGLVAVPLAVALWRR